MVRTNSLNVYLIVSKITVAWKFKSVANVCFLANFRLSITLLEMVVLIWYSDMFGQMYQISLDFKDVDVLLSESRDHNRS